MNNIKKKVITLGLSALFVLGFLTGVKANESNIVKVKHPYRSQLKLLRM